jgi:hypothetical protein
LKPGNAGGAKGPDFWCAFEDGEVKVIGDEPANTNYDPGPLEKAVSKDEGEKLAASTTLAAQLFSVCLSMKPVGEPDAGDRHVRFDERGWETERCRMAQATARILDSTITDITMFSADVCL